jgi:hypothetical protein
VITADGIYPGVFGMRRARATGAAACGDAAHGGADRTGDGQRAGQWTDGRGLAVEGVPRCGTGRARHGRRGGIPPELDVSVGAPAVFCSYCRFRSRSARLVYTTTI